MRERASDVRDVSDHLLAVLTSRSKGQPASMGRLGDALKADLEPVIIIADDLAPSETVQLDREKVLAFVTVHGSVNSHTAILAGTMNIPALVGTRLTSEEAQTGQSPHSVADALWMDGHPAIVDGYSGCLYVDPDPPQRMRILGKGHLSYRRGTVPAIQDSGGGHGRQACDHPHFRYRSR